MHLKILKLEFLSFTFHWKLNFSNKDKCSIQFKPSFICLVDRRIHAGGLFWMVICVIMVRVCRVSTSNQDCKMSAKLNCVSCEIAMSRNSCFKIRKLAIFRNPFYNSASNNTSKSSYNHGLEI